ncbi:hypothetical protein DFAR_3260003 [Desulfarculales bacterium]
MILAAPSAEFDHLVRTLLEESELALRVIVATNAFEPTSGKLCYQLVADLAQERGRGDVEVYVLGGPLLGDLVRPRTASECCRPRRGPERVG